MSAEKAEKKASVAYFLETVADRRSTDYETELRRSIREGAEFESDEAREQMLAAEAKYEELAVLLEAICLRHLSDSRPAKNSAWVDLVNNATIGFERWSVGLERDAEGKVMRLRQKLFSSVLDRFVVVDGSGLYIPADWRQTTIEEVEEFVDYLGFTREPGVHTRLMAFLKMAKPICWYETD